MLKNANNTFGGCFNNVRGLLLGHETASQYRRSGVTIKMLVLNYRMLTLSVDNEGRGNPDKGVQVLLRVTILAHLPDLSGTFAC